MLPAGRVARASQGSMLIELIIVSAIVAILAAIAIPSYFDMLVRAKVAEGLASLGPYKTAIVEQVETTGRLGTLPSDPADVDYVNVSGPVVVRRVRWSRLRGALELWYGPGAGPSLNGRILWLKPTLRANGSLIWNCVNHTEPAYAIDPRFLPSSCR